MAIRVEIEPMEGSNDPSSDNPGYVLRIRDAGNGEILLSTGSQSYADANSPIALARRIFQDKRWSKEGPEPVEMRVLFRSDEFITEQLR